MSEFPQKPTNTEAMAAFVQMEHQGNSQSPPIAAVSNGISQRDQPPPTMPRNPKGGLITMPFIIANEAFEKVTTYGLQFNVVFYLMKDYMMPLVKANALINYWTAATSFAPLVGAFVADSYLGRFLTIGLASIISFLGTVLLWLTAMIPKARPPPCDPNRQHCAGATQGQYALLLLSFGLMSIGAGGIRSGSLAFGADQIVSRDDLNNATTLESFFGWYYASYAVSIVVAFLGIGYIQDRFGWKLAFGLPAILMFLSPLVFCLASSLYVKRKATKSLFTGLVQVAVVAFKNRGLEYPPEASNGYHYEKGSIHTCPSDKLRFLNKACIIKNSQDVTSTGVSVNNWTLCTTDQVEELKALIRLLPMLSTSILIALSTYNTLPVVQASTMDRHLTEHFEIPSISFVVFSPLTITLWILLYDRAILPLASRIRGRKVYVGVKIRMGIGAFLISVSMAFVAIVEHIRRKKAIEQGLADNPGIVKMSAMWVALEYCLMGLGEAFFYVSQNEFFYSEFPKSMSSIAGSFGSVGAGIGNVLGGVFVTVVDGVTKSGGKESWVATNLNRGHMDYVYWILAVLTLGNALYYVLCSWAYGPCAETRETSDKSGDDEVRLLAVEEDKVV